MYHQLTDQFEVPATLDQVWTFFTTAENLPRITPPWLNFTTATQNPPTIQQDTILNYTIRWLKIPLRWQSRIIDFTPPRQFIDLQTRGPYILWHHQHTFTPTLHNTVVCLDKVIYKLPLGPLGRLVHAAFVKRQLLAIFHHRRTVIAQHLGWTRQLQPHPTIHRL